LFAGVGARSAGILSIAAIGFDLLFGSHECVLFRDGVGTERRRAGIGRGISNPIKRYHRAEFVKTARFPEIIENKPKIKIELL
jgi:hypothetical protein